MVEDKKIRRAIVRRNFAWFFSFYYGYGEYVDCETAPFHENMFAIAEDTGIPNALIAAFRDSAKSTILSEAFPVWAILGDQHLKNILIISRTQQQARGHLRSIRELLEKNSILQDDLGPFREEKSGPWSITSLYLKRYKARITAASMEQNIRGIKDGQHRPQLIICDDIENYDSIRTIESRNKTYEWLMGEVVPTGAKHARVFILGNLMHPDGIMKRQQKKIDAGNMRGIYLEVPILDENGNPTWPGKFPTKEAVEEYRKTKGIDEIAWQKEFMLKFPQDETQLIRRECITQEPIPPRKHEYGYRFSAIGIDLATSQKTTADYTAMVVLDVFGHGKERIIYVRPEFVNARMDSSETIRRIVSLSKIIGGGIPVPVYAERANLESFATGILKEEGVVVKTIKSGIDKEHRVLTVAPYIQLRKILFSPECPEPLLTQLVGFGQEKHDDVADAFTAGVIGILEEDDGYKGSKGIFEHMRNEYEEFKKNPNFPRNMNDWKRWTDRDGFRL